MPDLELRLYMVLITEAHVLFKLLAGVQHVHILSIESLVMVAEDHRDHVGMLGPDGHAIGDGQARHAALDDQVSLLAHSIDHLAPPLFGVDVKYARTRLFAERGFGSDLLHRKRVGHIGKE